MLNEDRPIRYAIDEISNAALNPGEPALYCLGFMFDKDREQVLLIRKHRPTWMKGRLNGIGGKVEVGESPLQAMHRESIEECGVDCDWKTFGILIHGRVGICLFEGSYQGGEIASLTDEAVAWYETHDLPITVMDNLRWLVPLAAYPAQQAILIHDTSEV